MALSGLLVGTYGTPTGLLAVCRELYMRENSAGSCVCVCVCVCVCESMQELNQTGGLDGGIEFESTY